MRFLSLLLLTLSLATSAQDAVTGKLLTDHTSIAKGQSFRLGLHLKMTDHWHTYWENPGFSGLPSAFETEGVEGLTLGKTQFPWPARFVDDAGFVTYGFDDETILIIDAVYNGDASEIELKGKITWLACKQQCIPGDAEVSLKLAVGEAKPVNTKLFDGYQKQVPTAATAETPIQVSSSFEFAEEAWNGTVTLSPKGTFKFADQKDAVEFRPYKSENGELKTVTVESDGDKRILKLNYEAFDTAEGDTISGAIKYTDDQGVTRYLRAQFHPASANNAQAAAAPVTSETSGDANAPATATPGGSFAFFLLLAFLGGMILNLMPCVLPVLSLKVFSLINEAGESTIRRIKFGWAYTFGVLACFWIISGFFVAAQAAGQQLGVGFQFQSPTFVIGIAVLIFVMGLSFTGVFHFGQPNSQKLHDLSQKSGYQGAFFQGVLMTILSTPCTAPGVGAAYGWAVSQPPLNLIIIFSTVGFGLAFPYLLLCYAPSLLKFLPKPGAWMEYFKVAMGFLLLGTVIWLVSVFGSLTGNSGVVGLLTFLLGIAAACFIYDKTWYSDNRNRGLGLAVLTLAACAYLGLNVLFDVTNPTKERDKLRQELRIALQAELQASGGGDIASLMETIKTTRDDIGWIPYTPQGLESLRNSNKLIFLDFTAAWCLTCKANERLVIDTKDIRNAFVDMEVVAMKADYTDKSDHLTEIIKSFGRAGVPLYLVYPGNGDPILLPETITKGIVMDALEEATQSLNQQASL